MRPYSYGYTWPTEEKMKASKTFAAGIYRSRMVRGKEVREPCGWCVSGPTVWQKSVKAKVEKIINQLKLGSYRGGKRVDVCMEGVYRVPFNRSMSNAGT